MNDIWNNEIIMRSIIFACLWIGIVAIFWSCSETTSPVHADTLLTDTTQEATVADINVIKPQTVIEKDSFLIDTFMSQIDSFFTSYAGGNTGVNYTRKRIQSDTSNALFNNILSLPDENSAIDYYFIVGDENNSGMGFMLIIANYPDSATTDKSWKHVVAMSGPPNATSGDKLPCISYTNDYIFRTGNKIFWLGTGCTWSYKHHMLIASFLRRSIYNCDVIDEIKCDCGGVRPMK